MSVSHVLPIWTFNIVTLGRILGPKSASSLTKIGNTRSVNG